MFSHAITGTVRDHGQHLGWRFRPRSGSRHHVGPSMSFINIGYHGLQRHRSVLGLFRRNRIGHRPTSAPTFPASRTSANSTTSRLNSFTARCNRDGWRTWAIPSPGCIQAHRHQGHRPTSQAYSTSAATSRGSSATRRPRDVDVRPQPGNASANSTSASPT